MNSILSASNNWSSLSRPHKTSVEEPAGLADERNQIDANASFAGYCSAKLASARQFH